MTYDKQKTGIFSSDGGATWYALYKGNTVVGGVSRDDAANALDWQIERAKEEAANPRTPKKG